MVNGRTVAEDMAARHEERNGEPPQWPRWIPVAERLPEFGDAVLVYIPFVRHCEARRIRTGWNLNGRAQFDGTEYWVWVDDAGCVDVLPTHWMPLPPPPGE